MKIEKKGDRLAVFEILGLYPGYGITLGNALRRVLLSSLEGAAITEVKIKDVAHEFSTIPGVMEDVIIILLNLKKLRFKMFGSEPQKASLKVKGEKEVKGSDLKLPSQVELVNGDSHIATLTSKNASLEMEVKIERGIGYESAETRKKQKAEIGVIHLDAIYTPIKRVSFTVENMRVGERTDFDRLFIEVETDGTIEPEQAFGQAVGLLLEHFSFLGKGKPEKKEKAKEKVKEKVKEKKVETDVSKTKIEDLKLSTRTANILLESGIKTVGGLIRKREEEVLNLKGMGDKGLKEIKKVLKGLRLSLKE
jgi:DNA-directed RNA polymerase subunit alpha